MYLFLKSFSLLYIILLSYGIKSCFFRFFFFFFFARGKEFLKKQLRKKCRFEHGSLTFSHEISFTCC